MSDIRDEIAQANARSSSKSPKNKLPNVKSGIFLSYFVKSVIILKFFDRLHYFLNVLAYFVFVLAYFVVELVFGLVYFFDVIIVWISLFLLRKCLFDLAYFSVFS